MLRCVLAASVLVGMVSSVLAQEPAAVPVSVFGRVTDLLGEGIPAAEVWITAKDGKVLGRTVADGEGQYRVMRLSAARDASFELHARAKGFVEHSERVAGIGPARAASLQLEEGAPLGGTVVRADGSPIAGAAVLVMTRIDGRAPLRLEATADQNGAWRIATVPLRRLRVNVWAPGFAMGSEAIDPSDQLVRTSLETSPVAARRVRVTGVPAGVQAVVLCAPWSGEETEFARLPGAMLSAPVAADGTAQVWPLPVHHDLKVEAVGFACVPAEIACLRSASGTHEFALVTASAAPAREKQSEGFATARIVDPDGKPLAGVRVLVHQDSLESFSDHVLAHRNPAADDRDVIEARTDAEGKFTLPAPRAELHRFLAAASEEWHFVEDDGDAGAGDDVGRVWVAMPDDGLVHAARAGSIRGVLRTASGQVLVGARVSVVRWREARVDTFDCASDEAGRVEIRAPVGDYELRVTAMDGTRFQPIAASCALNPAVALPALAPAPVGEVRGFVRDANGQPCPGVPVHWWIAQEAGTDEPSFAADVWTDRRGCFRARNLAVGTWCVSGPDLRSGAAIEVKVEAGKAAEAAIQR